MLNVINQVAQKASLKVFILLSLLLACLAIAGAQNVQGTAATAKDKALLEKHRTGFVENKGQWSKSAKFLARRKGLNVWFTDKSVLFEMRQSSAKAKSGKAKGHAVDMAFLGANPKAKASGNVNRGARTDFLSASKQIRGVKTYEGVAYKGLYKGVDMLWYYDRGTPRFDFVVAPGADTNSIKLRFNGADNVKIDQTGNLRVGTTLGALYQADLKAYQEVNGLRKDVSASFKYLDDNTIGFALGDYDHSKQIVIDPLVYGSYYGGDSGMDEIHGVVADADFSVVITGYTEAPDFPAIFGPFSWNVNGVRDAFVSKFQGDAYNHDYSAYVGGSGNDEGWYVGMTHDGNEIWVAGTTTSADLPLAGGGLYPARSGTSDLWLMRFTKDVVQFLIPDYSTYYGNATANGEVLKGLVVDPLNDEVSIAGESTGVLPNTNNGQLGGRDCFLTRFTVDAAGLSGTRWSYYIGGDTSNFCGGLATDVSGNLVISGTVVSNAVIDTSVNQTAIDTTPGVYPNGQLLRFTDGFIRKLAPDGTVAFCSVLGGNGTDEADGVAIDPIGNIYITGLARSFNFPRTIGVYGENFTANEIVYATKISPNGDTIIYSTHLNTVAPVFPRGIGVDSRGNAYVAGVVEFTHTFPFPPADPNEPNGVSFGSVPITSDALDPDYGSPQPPELGTSEGFLLALNPTAQQLFYGTYLGGDLDEQVFAPYVDRFGDVWCVGSTDSLRYYERMASGGAITAYLTTSALPPALISQFAFKTVGDAFGLTLNTGVLYGLRESPFTAPPTIDTLNQRDGFLVKQRLALPTITGISLTPGTVAGGLGATVAGVVTLSGPAPIGGVDVTVDLNNTAASFDPNNPVSQTTLNLAAGATTANFTLYTFPVTLPTQVNVKATLEGNFFIRQLTVVPWLQELTCTPNTLVGGNNVIGRIKLQQPAITDVTVDLSTDASGLVEFPNGVQVIIPVGEQMMTFPIVTHGVEFPTDVPVTASLLGVGRTDFIRLLPANLSIVKFNPPKVTSGASSTGTVELDGECGGNGFVVDLVLGPGTPGYTLSTATLTFVAGERSKDFTINTVVEASNTQRSVTASRTAQGGFIAQSISGNLFVDAATLVSFSIDKTSVDVGEDATGTITVNVPANPSGTPVDVTANSPLVTIATPVFVPGAATSVDFPIVVTTEAQIVDTIVDITASRGPVNITKQLTIKKSTGAITFTPTQVVGGFPATGHLSISAPAPAGGLIFNLVSSNPAAATVPANATIIQGDTNVDFAVTTFLVASTVGVTVTGTCGSLVADGVLVVKAVSVATLQFVPAKVKGGAFVNLTVTLDSPAPPGNATVLLSTSNPAVATIPPSMIVTAGQTTKTISIHTNRVSRTLSTQVQAFLGDNLAFATLTVTR